MRYETLSVLAVLTSATAASAQPAPAPEAEPAPAPEPAGPKPAQNPRVVATYDKGVLLATEDGAFQLRVALRNQFRFELTRPTEDGAETDSRMYIPRSRLQLEGHVFGKDTRYKAEAALGDRGSFGHLRDVYLEQRLVSSPVWLRVGQWKRPFNRQELVSDFASELNERAITAEFAGGGRDVGVAVHNDYEKSPDGLEWAAGVFNGFSGGADRPVISTTCEEDPTTMEIDCATPAPSNFPTDFSPAVVVRAGWNTGGIKGYSEGDLEGGPLRVAVGLAYKIDLADLGEGAEDSTADNLSHGLEADALVKTSGFDLQLGAYLMKIKSGDARLAAFVQAGYFVTPKRAQVAGRFAIVQAADDREQLEARAAFNWYFQGHAWKLANDVGVLQTTGEDPTTMTTDDPDLQVRSMAQLTF
jgi:hypothetical protein